MKIDGLETDTEFADTTIKEVKSFSEGWEISGDDGWSFFIPKKPHVEPKAGMRARFFGRGTGHPVRGLVLFDNSLGAAEVVFYRTAAEDKERHREWCEREAAKKKQEFEHDREKRDRRIAKLPEVFRRRFAKFHKTNTDFRWRYEDYELFCCEEAVRIAEVLKTPEAVLGFRDLDTKGQKERVPNLDYANHSGNTFGASVRLAYLYLRNPELVVKEHGALTTLVGCKEYGCPHPYDEPTRMVKEPLPQKRV